MQSPTSSFVHLNKTTGRIWLDLEYQECHLTNNEHRKGYREVNKRILSLEDDLWLQQEALRDQEKKLDLVPDCWRGRIDVYIIM